MTSEYATYYIPLRMKELDYKEYLAPRWRNILVKNGASKSIKAGRSVYLLVDMDSLIASLMGRTLGGTVGPGTTVGGLPTIKVSSENGSYDLTGTVNSEQVFEHTGKIKLENSSGADVYLRFIQIIPKSKAKCKQK